MHKRQWLACCFMAAALFVANKSEAIIEGAIVGADDPLGQSVVQLAIKVEAAEISCSGVIIDKRWVLTAGHCLLGATEVGVEFPFAPPGSFMAAQNYDRHPQYMEDPDVRQTSYDFGLIQLPADVPAPYHPAEIGKDDSVLKIPGLFAAYGFGLDDRGINGTLRKATIFVESVIRYRLSIHSQYGANICSGDSGGPIFFDGRLVAISSAGAKSGCKGGWSLGAMVTRGLPWIEESLAANKPAP